MQFPGTAACRARSQRVKTGPAPRAIGTPPLALLALERRLLDDVLEIAGQAIPGLERVARRAEQRDLVVRADVRQERLESAERCISVRSAHVTSRASNSRRATGVGIGAGCGCRTGTWCPSRCAT